MSHLYILVLSAIQGLTEFLPVSSSAHLALAPRFFGEKDQGQIIDAAMHLGTLLAALIYYRQDVLEIALGFLKWRDPKRGQARRLGIFIALASLPALALGFIVHLLIPEGIRSVTVIAATTLIFGLAMGYADKKHPEKEGVEGMSLRQAMIIGCAQALAAMMPGVSRSGITMTAARFMDFRRIDAARFSFLLGMPATAAAAALSFWELYKSHDAVMLHEGMLAAFFTFFFGLGAIYLLIRWLNRFGLMPYVVYRILLSFYLLVKFIIPGLK
ncbi:MAG: undecaprenyl-diphosphate phosphatase [Alphaproteobacteria bacterium]|nr:MAG: undecaprenyl-diphosphate phosphatase [Alphaproteobacteria bacterium]